MSTLNIFMRTKHIDHFEDGGREALAICTIFLLSAGHALPKKVPCVLLIDDGALLSADSTINLPALRVLYCMCAVYYAPDPHFCA